jgi:hypothetical protein
LKEAGIETRSAHFHHGNLSQPAFGKRIRDGKEVTNHGEKVVIQQIQALHISGQSLRQIAKTLTKMGVETKNKSKVWHPQMISRILKSGSN